MTEVFDADKTAPVLLLENRRRHLIQWLADGQGKIAEAERTIKETKQSAVEMTAEIDAIEKALNILQAKEQHG